MRAEPLLAFDAGAVRWRSETRDSRDSSYVTIVTCWEHRIQSAYGSRPKEALCEGAQLLGPRGLLTDLTKTMLETALEVEMEDHLGYAKYAPVGRDLCHKRVVEPLVVSEAVRAESLRQPVVVRETVAEPPVASARRLVRVAWHKGAFRW